MSYWFNLLFYQPLFNLLVFLYNFLPGHDIGLAIVVLTIIVKALLYPLSLKGLRAQKALSDLQPKLESLKKKYKDNKEKLAQEMIKLYKAEKVNPLSSCFPLLIQFPFLLAIFKVFQNGFLEENLSLLYSFIPNPGVINPISFGFIEAKRSPFSFDSFEKWKIFLNY